ncbi:MAG: DUF5107 domain-containing protein [Chitinophagaceae bacterium]|nr:DUF5107 domain-containing protein [Chitinophagaceae bacterium]
MVTAWQEKVKIPTYKIGAPDRNPMFLEKRVYQGSSGVVYPHAVIDKVSDEKEDKEWTALFLENEYLKVMILPELGGRIQMAYDKTNDYHFVYYNQVIKPALVGLAGPWISGGIEFNWPQHHRPSTFGPTDFLIKENEDGSKTVWVNEYEMMFGTKCALGFTLYPRTAYIELHASLYNRTAFPQTFLWWANPAVAVDEHYQSVFPPDVHAVFDHGKRDVSSFPIATGTYYKVDYSPGTDISRYNNIPVPTSYMAVNSAFNFVGGYHHQKQAGIMHIANHHVSPGKKQWTWGCGDFGQAWDRQLTDEDGPYFELMCGVYTDNQPDFGWIMPNEVRAFKQYFMPYKNIGYVKNASTEAMLNMETANEHSVEIKAYVTQPRKVTIGLKQNGVEVFNEEAELSPEKTFSKNISLTGSGELYAYILDDAGNVLIDYTPVSRQGEAIPDPAKPIADPKDITTNEALFLAGLHLEQYRHATYSPLDYYDEALRRDNSDIRCNNAKGLWFLRRGQFETAEPFFRTAVEKLNKHNPNPYDGEPLYNLGLCLKYRGRYNEAINFLYKSTWNAAMQDNAYLQLAYISAIKNNWSDALELVNQSILKNYNGLKGRHLKAVTLRKLNRTKEAIRLINETLETDGFDFASRYELLQCFTSIGDDAEKQKIVKVLQALMQQRGYTFIEMALQYADAGLYADAAALLLLNEKVETDVLSLYYLAYFEHKNGNTAKAKEWLAKAFEQSPDRIFPNRIEDIAVLKTATALNHADYKAHYYLGNYYYGKRLYAQAREHWEKAAAINNTHATTLRNLGIVYYNKFDKKDEALQLFEKAFAADTTDARILFELDQLYKRFNTAPEERLAKLSNHFSLVQERDDLYIEYVTLHSVTGQYEKAKALLSKRNFHPWEGGEGKTSGQHVLIHVALAKQAIAAGNLQKAEILLQQAQVYPHNLGEGKIYGAQENDIFYWLGCLYEKKGDLQKARDYWQLASTGLSEPAPAIFYNDQQPDKIFYQGLALQKLGDETAAQQRFNNLVAYGKQHLNDVVKMDFFAVSLPDLMIFDDDLSLRNTIHCYYLMALGLTGKGEAGAGKEYFEKVLALDKAHTGAALHGK